MRAYAYIVETANRPGDALSDVARSVGFEGTAPFSGLSQAAHQLAHTPICFFLFAATKNLSPYRQVADSIRFSANRRLRFSPMIYFTDAASAEEIGACINMGFDDIITMPFSRQRVIDRLARQIGTPLTYYETASYFGPDRRGRGQLPDRGADTRLSMGGQHRRIEIVRHISTGVSVLSDSRHVETV
ncbi:MAG: hypothetical protein KIT02_14885 [Devosia sp.]|uniref:hypothetical protein n=1 Tax=Devosia sp. TaxID=1871048 RepID=UPI0024C5887C|nr:hypothetical protein [Devosia sp.]UYN99191.1 MAG: hypothetical protein KIT02_14885 [Devosia sp.]